MTIVFKNLTDSLPKGVAYTISDHHTPLVGVKNLDLSSTLDTNVVYYGSLEYLQQIDISGISHFIALTSEQGSSHETIKSFSNSNVVLFEDSDQFNHFIATAKSLFANSQYISNLAYELLVLIQDGASLEQLMDVAYKHLGNPILLVDVSFVVMASIATSGIHDEPTWEYAMNHGCMPVNYMNEVIEEQKLYETLSTTSSPLILWKEGKRLSVNNSQLSGKIIKNNQVLAYMKVLEYNRKFEALDRLILSTLCRYFSLAIHDKINTKLFNHSLIDTFLLNLISNKITDEETIEERRRSFQLKLYDKLYIITIEFNKNEDYSDHIYYVKRKIQNHLNRSTVVLFDSRLVVLYDTRVDDEFFTHTILKNLEEELLKEECMAYISIPFKKLKNVHAHYQQTLFCRHIKEVLNTTSTIIRYEHIIEKHMVVHFSNVVDLKYLLLPDVKKLIKIDREKGSELLETLFCYVSHKQDMSATADALFIHYNTLKYRINKIRELTDLDLDAPRTVLLLLLSKEVLSLKKD